MVIADKSLLEWYRKGFNDELRGNTTVESENAIEMKAYDIGAKHSSGKWNNTKIIDDLSDEKILILIKK